MPPILLTAAIVLILEIPESDENENEEEEEEDEDYIWEFCNFSRTRLLYLAKTHGI